MKLYIDVAEAVNDSIYFTAINTNGLYRIYQGKLELVDALYEQQDYERKYAGMVYNRGKIWIFPWSGKMIWIYSILDNMLENIELPKKYLDNTRLGARLRKPIVAGNKVWLVAAHTSEILCINMDTYEAVGYKNWNNEIGVKEINCFKSGFFANDRLYLFKDKAKRSAVLKPDSGTNCVWNTEDGYMFGMNIKDSFYYIPTTCKKPLLKEAENKEKIPVPNCYWGEANPYQYWYAVGVGDKLVILPHNAGSIMLIEKEKVTHIDTRHIKMNTLNGKENFSAYHAFSYLNQIIIVPYWGDEFFCLRDDTKIEGMGKLYTEETCDEIRTFIKWGIMHTGYSYEEESDKDNFIIYHLARKGK